MPRSTSWFVALGLVTVTAAGPAAYADPVPVAIASCGDSKLEVARRTANGPGELHAVIASGGNRWSLSATVGIARIGGKTRTVTVDDLHTQERVPPRGKDASPSGLVIDLLLDDKKVLLRHSSEGGSDVDYAVDLDKCSFPREGDGVLAGLVPPPPEPVGCAPATVKGPYRTQVGLVAKLADADADREAQALCEDHQKTIEARVKLDQVLTDRAARARIAARGAALLRTEDARDKAWSRVDGCPTVDPDKAKGTAALHDGEAKLRACYGQIAAKP